MIYRIYIVLIILIGISVKGQEIESYEETTVQAVDSLSIIRRNSLKADSVLQYNYTTNNQTYPRKFSDQLASKYQDDEFDYNIKRANESLWAKISRKIAQIFRSIFGKTDFRGAGDFASFFIKLFAIILIAFLLYFFIRYMVDKEGTFFFSKKNRKIHSYNETFTEDIHQIRFEDHIRDFENKNNYRMAIRYRFLYVLKKLSDQKIITWNSEKTNRDYYREINSPSLKAQFFELVRIFDNVWYGEFEIDADSYRRYKLKFEQFKG